MATSTVFKHDLNHMLWTNRRPLVTVDIADSRCDTSVPHAGVSTRAVMRMTRRIVAQPGFDFGPDGRGSPPQTRFYSFSVAHRHPELLCSSAAELGTCASRASVRHFFRPPAVEVLWPEPFWCIVPTTAGLARSSPGKSFPSRGEPSWHGLPHKHCVGTAPLHLQGMAGRGPRRKGPHLDGPIRRFCAGRWS